MIYVDTSVLVALLTVEGKTADVAKWYERCTDTLVCAAWGVTEFASALGIKQRTGQLNKAQAEGCWQRFERLCVGDLRLLAVEATAFHAAARLTMEGTGLRAGDALHLACALEHGATSMATLGDVLAKNAKQKKLKLVSL